VLSFAPLQVNGTTAPSVRDLLVWVDKDYRAIRRSTGIYPSAGTYVVYIHRWSTDPPNPYPDIMRQVHAGRLYNVYELNGTGARSIIP
jgi:hypothetical protein